MLLTSPASSMFNNNSTAVSITSWLYFLAISIADLMTSRYLSLFIFFKCDKDLRPNTARNSKCGVSFSTALLRPVVFDVLSVAETKGDGENSAGTPCIEAEISEQEQIVSYVARLLHDPDFLGFVEKLETYMSNTTDGAKILEGLGRQSLTLQNGE